MKYIVYKTTNNINGKVYIGVHRTNPDVFDGYIGCGITQKDSKKGRLKGFPAAVRKYGYRNFTREVLFQFPDTEEGMRAAYTKEAELVTLDFVKDKNTYNLITGGKFTTYETLKKVIAQYTLDGKFLRTWSSITEACDTLGLTAISNCLIGKSKYCGDFQWRYYTDESDISPVIKRERAVYQFDLCGNLIKTWKSAAAAAQMFKNTDSACIAIYNVCNNRTRQAYGYYWSYRPRFDYNEYSWTKAVARYNDAGNFIESYSSLKEAAEAVNLQSTAPISYAISGRQKHAGGFRWRFFYGNKGNIKSL